MPAITLIQCLYFPRAILFGLNRVDALGEGMPAMYSDTMSLFPQVLSCLVLK